jgi:uncharacterized protein (DUF58 family)
LSNIEQARLEQFSSLEFLARQVVEGFITGLHKSPFHGFSVEFAEHRLYNSGESIKSIDWKLYGRTDRLFTKRYEEETNLRCQIFIDNSSSMYFPAIHRPDIDHPMKITFAVYIAATLLHLFKRQRDAAGISLISDDLDLHTQSRSSSVHFRYLFSELEKLLSPRPPEVKKGTNVARTIHELAERIHKRSLVIILSDMFERGSDTGELFSALRHLKHNKHEVVVFHVVDKSKELDFDFEDRPYRFIDLETGEQVRMHPGSYRDPYREMLAKYKEDLKVKAGQYQIDLVEADINGGFSQVLLPYLVKRSKLF